MDDKSQKLLRAVAVSSALAIRSSTVEVARFI